MAHFMIQCAIGIALAPIDIIARDLQTEDAGEQSWFISSYALTVGTFILISGRAGDILGHKRVFIFGFAYLGFWSALAGFAAFPRSQIFFDVCRSMQGVGSAILMPNALALLGRSYPPGPRKNIIFSIFGASAPFGAATGNIFGSIFGQLLWWPWGFWAYAIAAFGLAIFSLIIIPKPLSAMPPHRPSFDWTGSLLGVMSLVLINVAFNNGPLYGWDQPHVYFILIIGLLLLVGFVYVELRAINPLLPKSALNSTTLWILGCVALGWGAFGVWVFYTFRFLEVVRQQTPLLVSAEFVPVIVAAVLASGVTGYMLSHTPVSFVMLCAMAGFFLGIALVGTMPIHQTYWGQAFFGILVMPIGMDMSFPASTVILSNSMPGEHQGLAAALVTTVINYSVSITLGIAALVEVQVAKPGGRLEDIADAMHSAYYVGIAFGAAAVVLAGVFFVRTYLKEGWKVMAH
ncbi:yor378w-like protein [Neofusicoccum parvum]|uniref:Putative yor378w-like protein n=1 Tax=Botryosphaeria parva (strain UCR-NP2) TaxID=1287680 RepID=R1G0B5_BOTPV|nr:putative yor378w-like protein [Neofusicoccum parvum UCRNP2]GME44670.1 yor378w-like protein [Neofusicoccum parvum]